MNTNRTIAAAPGKPGMSADRKAAVWIGVLYIIGTVALVLSFVVTGAVLTGPAYLAQVAAQPNQVAVGALLVLLAGFALAMVPVVFWPVGKRYNETLAMGYVVFRGATRDGHLHRRRARVAAADRAQHGAGCGTARRLRAHDRGRDLGPADRHPVRSRRADVLRPALPVAARAPVAVRLGARGGRALHRAAAWEHVRALARRPHGPARPAGDGHGGVADRQGLQPICHRRRACR